MTKKDEYQPKHLMKRDESRDSYEWIQALVCSVLAVVLVFTFVARLIGVDGPSMVPTLQNGDRLVVVSSLLYHDYKPGDIVVARKDSFMSDPIVKRVIAVEGQTVDIDFDTGCVYVDGELLDEPYIKEPMYRPDPFRSPEMQQTHWEVPEGSIFVMGDNRNNSTDSRDDRLGPIDEGYLLGKVVLALWPPDRFGLM